MKKLIALGAMVFVFVLCLGAIGNKVGYNVNLSVTMEDSITAADTAITSVRADTFYSTWVDVAGASLIQFYSVMKPPPSGATYADLTTDTFWFDFQHSFDRVNIRTMLIDTLLDTVEIGNWDEFTVSTTDSVIGGWGRLRAIHWDSTEATSPDSLGNMRKWTMDLWMNITR